MKNNLLKISSLIIFVTLTAFVYSQLFNSTDLNLKQIKSTQFMEADIIFQTSSSLQSKAIQIATNSKYSHVGIIMKYDGKLVVLEAVQPIKLTPIKGWINHGENSAYSLKRLKNREEVLTKSSLKKMREKGSNWIGKDYDIAFDWSDRKLYCSELVWKLYKEGCGIEVGKLKKLKDYDLSNPLVKKAIKQRYGNDIPREEKMISPQAIFDSELLETVN